MPKIFKYEVKDGIAELPVGSRVIRQDHVDDGFYLGDFVWAIVDPEEKQTVVHPFTQDKPPTPTGLRLVTIAVKEKQEVISGVPVLAGEFDGYLCIYCKRSGISRRRKIAVYKTGQEIDIDLDKLTYLGLNRIWIVQELGLYTFWVNE